MLTDLFTTCFVACCGCRRMNMMAPFAIALARLKLPVGVVQDVVSASSHLLASKFERHLSFYDAKFAA